MFDKILFDDETHIFHSRHSIIENCVDENKFQFFFIFSLYFFCDNVDDGAEGLRSQSFRVSWEHWSLSDIVQS